jgi:hypothetical protein
MTTRIVHIRVEDAAWLVEVDGHPSRAVESADVALAFARGLAGLSGRGEVRIHRPDGSVQSEYFGDEDAPVTRTAARPLRRRPQGTVH